MREAPSKYEAIAEKAEKEGRYKDAAEAWRMARAVSIGHTRRAMYEAAAKRCEDSI